jgi:hypothetical protein
MAAEIKYGIVKNEQIAPVLYIPMGASEVVPAGGCFVVDDGSSRMEVAGDGSTLLAGYVFPTALDAGYKYQTCSSTEGGTLLPFIPIEAMAGVVVRLPVNTGAATTVATCRAKYNRTCDLSVSSNVQGLQAGTSTEDTVLIVGGDETGFAWFDVIPCLEKITGKTGVA